MRMLRELMSSPPHSTEQADLTQLWNEQRELIALLKGNGLRGGPGAFGHIAGGYDVGYYG